MRVPTWPILALVATTGCAFVSKSSTLSDRKLSDTNGVGQPYDPRITGKTSTSAEGLTIALASVSSCDRTTMRRVRRTEHIRRSVSTFTQIVEYGFGLAFTGVGGYVAYENKGRDENQETRPYDVGTPRTAMIAGLSAVGVGSLLLLAGVVDSVRAMDGTRDLGEAKVPVPGTFKTFACAKQPAKGAELALVVGRTRLPLGRTGAAGELKVAWSALPADVRAAQSKGVVWAGATRVGEVDLGAAGAVLAEAAWTAAKTANTRAAYESYRKTYPELHPEAEALLRDLRARELETGLSAALAASDPVAARARLEELRALEPSNATLVARGDELRALEQRAGDAQIERLLTAAEAKDAPVLAMRELLTQLASAQGSEVAARADVRKRVATAGKVHLKRLLALVGTLDKQRDEAALDAALADALVIAPADAAVAKLRAKVEKRRQRQLSDSDKLSAAAAKKAEAAERKAEKQRLDAEKKAEKERLAAEKKAEKERLAAEKKAEKERLAALKSSERQQSSAERKAEKERLAAQLKADKEAEKQRLLTEKENEKARLAAEKQAEKDRVASEKAEKERLATEKKVAAMTPTLAYKLDARFKDDNILSRMPFPDSCAVALAGQQSRADVRCPAYSVLVTKKGVDLGAICSGRSCGQCTELLTKWMAPFTKASGPETKLVKSCE